MLRPAAEPDLDIVASWIRTARDCEFWAGPRLAFPLERLTLARDIDLSPETSFCIGEPNIEAFGQLIDKGSGRGHLAKIIVAPELRRSGRGSMLIRSLLSLAGTRGFTVVGLNVQTANKAALSLYHKLGFESAVRPAAVTQSFGAVYMVRNLPFVGTDRER